jgi:hypothetical protein
MGSGIVVAGVAAARLNGQPIHVVGDMVLNLGTPIRETLESATGPVGYKQRAGQPSIEFETTVDLDTTVEELATFSGGDFTVTTHDGRTFTFSDAWAESDGNYQAHESKLPLIIKAKRAEEVSPQSS